jgi:WD40 repeat protein
MLRDASSLETVRELRNDELTDCEAADFVFSPDGGRLLIGWQGSDKAAQAIYDLANGDVTQSFEIALDGDTGRWSVEWLPDGKTVVIGDRLIDVESKAVRGTFNQFHEWSDDGNRVLGKDVNSAFPQVKYLPPDGEKSTVLFEHVAADSVTSYSAVWSPDGKTFTTNGKQFFEFGSGSIAREAGFSERFCVVSWSPDGTRMLCQNHNTGAKNQVRAWPDGELLAELKFSFDAKSHAWSPDSSRIVLGEYQGNDSVAICDAKTGEILQRWNVPRAGAGIYYLDWYDDRIAITAWGSQENNSIYIYSAADGSLIQTVRNLYQAHEAWWVAGGKQLLCSGKEAWVLVNASEWVRLHSYDVHGGRPSTLRVLTDNTALVATTEGKVLRLNLNSGSQEQIAEFAGDPVQISPDGQYLASDLGNVRRIIRLSDGETLVSLVTESSFVSPDGHVWTPENPRGGAWALSPGVANRFVYVVQTASGQETLTPQQFASRYGWQNDPAKVRLK